MSWTDECRKLRGLLNQSEQLLNVIPALHRTVNGLRTQPIWLGVGKIRSRDEYAVFLFTRAVIACLRPLQEWLYCVLPVVANVRLEVSPQRLTFTWSGGQRGGSNLLVELGDDEASALELSSSRTLSCLQEAFREASVRGLVFHEEQRNNHRELWRYEHAIPVDLARLPSIAVAVSGSRRTRISLHENLLCDAHRLQLLCITWNVGASLPQEGQKLDGLFEEEPDADLLCIGLQETCELSARRLIADGDEWYEWRAWVESEVNDFYGDGLEVVAYSHLVGMLILIFAKSNLRDQIDDIRTTAVGLGVGGYGGNKGAVSVRFDISSTSFCFVNAHLASGQEHYIERCQHFQMIMQRIIFQEDTDADYEDGPRDSQGSTRSSPDAFDNDLADLFDLKMSVSFLEKRTFAREAYKIYDHDHIFWVGDTNSRLHWPGKLGGMPIQDAMQKVRERRIGELLALDQLNLMRRDGMAFQGFDEHKICFLPSYKWRRDGDALDMRSQKHVPAWTDRILFRSMTRPAATVHRYDMYPNLRQSDHRPVFACLTVPWTGAPSASSEQVLQSRSMEPCHELELVMEPAEVVFRNLKPDHPQETTVRLNINGLSTSRFKVYVKWPDGRLRPVSSRATSARKSMTIEEEGSDSSSPALKEPVLARWLCVTPSQGTLHRGRATELKVSLCVGEAVLERHSLATNVIVRLQDSALHDFEMPVRASVLPSLLRAPLEMLAQKGSRPILQVKDEQEDRASSNNMLPPCEIMAVMQWVLQQSREAHPRELDWWPDPLSDGVCRGREEFCEVQRYLEQGWSLPTGNPRLPPRSAALFLLRWLSLLPEPILSAEALQAESLQVHELLQAMPALPRGVLFCVAALFAQLAVRHGPKGDVASRLATCLTQQARPSAAAEQLLRGLMAELSADSTFPPPAAWQPLSWNTD